MLNWAPLNLNPAVEIVKTRKNSQALEGHEGVGKKALKTGWLLHPKSEGKWNPQQVPDPLSSCSSWPSW